MPEKISRRRFLIDAWAFSVIFAGSRLLAFNAIEAEDPQEPEDEGPEQDQEAEAGTPEAPYFCRCCSNPDCQANKWTCPS